MSRSWTRAAAVTAAAAMGLALGLVAPSAAIAADVSYERTAYDGTIWQVTPDGVHALSWTEWSDLGFPGFVAADTEYVRVAPFATVYAVTWFDLAQQEFTEPITYPEFRAAGQPRPQVVAWSDDIEVHKWPTSPELFAVDPTGSTVKLSYAQWSAAGFPGFVDRSNRGFVSMTWDGSGAIAYMCDIAAGRGGRLTYEQWLSHGSPTPTKVKRTNADFVYKLAGTSSSTIYYSGPVVRTYAPETLSSELPFRRLTYAEWQGMGQPAPLVTNTTYPENWFCSTAQPSPQE